jgi:hypothetical protein
MNEAALFHAPSSSELTKLIGTYRTIGEYGPIYQVLSILDSKRAKVVLLETDEEVTYGIEDILQDPAPKS